MYVIVYRRVEKLRGTVHITVRLTVSVLNEEGNTEVWLFLPGLSPCWCRSVGFFLCTGFTFGFLQGFPGLPPSDSVYLCVFFLGFHHLFPPPRVVISEHVTSNASDSESSYRKFSLYFPPRSVSPAVLVRTSGFTFNIWCFLTNTRTPYMYTFMHRNHWQYSAYYCIQHSLLGLWVNHVVRQKGGSDFPSVGRALQWWGWMFEKAGRRGGSAQAQRYKTKINPLG